MTAADTVRRLLVDAAGEPLCDACLAFACSVTLDEMREVTEELLTHPTFHRRDRCVSCRRTAPALAYSAKCAHCSRPVGRDDDALEIGSDILHAVCFNMLASDENMQVSHNLGQQSRLLVEKARTERRRMREGAA